MNTKNTLIICAFEFCGRHYAERHSEELNVSILNLETSIFATVLRQRTPEELEERKKDWERTPHLMSPEGYLNKIRKDRIFASNPEYPNNLIKTIKENMGKVDYILLNCTKQLLEVLKDNNIPFIVVLPSLEMKFEWIGRSCCSNVNDYFTKLFIDSWSDRLLELERAVPKNYLFKLNHKQLYLFDILKNKQ